MVIPVRICALAVLLLLSRVTIAQELEPRSYTNLPIDQSFLVLGYSSADGALSPSPSSPVQEADLTTDIAILGFATSLDLGGKSGKFEIVNTRSCIEGYIVLETERREGRRCGYGDPALKLTYNFYGAPALTLKEFQSWDPGLVIGASLKVTAPVGTYLNDKIINTGGNRWVLRPGIGLSNKHGRFSYDLSASVRFFEDNDDFLQGGTLEQDPLYQLQTHLIYSLRKGRWLALNLNFFRGGNTRKNGIKQDEMQENSRVGITYSMPLNAHHSLKFFANDKFVTRIGNDFHSLGFAWQYRF